MVRFFGKFIQDEVYPIDQIIEKGNKIVLEYRKVPLSQTGLLGK